MLIDKRDLPSLHNTSLGRAPWCINCATNHTLRNSLHAFDDVLHTSPESKAMLQRLWDIRFVVIVVHLHGGALLDRVVVVKRSETWSDDRVGRSREWQVNIRILISIIHKKLRCVQHHERWNWLSSTWGDIVTQARQLRIWSKENIYLLSYRTISSEDVLTWHDMWSSENFFEGTWRFWFEVRDVCELQCKSHWVAHSPRQSTNDRARIM